MLEFCKFEQLLMLSGSSLAVTESGVFSGSKDKLQVKTTGSKHIRNLAVKVEAVSNPD